MFPHQRDKFRTYICSDVAAPWRIKPYYSSAPVSLLLLLPGVHRGVREHLLVAGLVHGRLVVGEFLNEVVLAGTNRG